MCKQSIPNEYCANTYLNQTVIDKSEIENFKSSQRQKDIMQRNKDKNDRRFLIHNPCKPEEGKRKRGKGGESLL